MKPAKPKDSKKSAAMQRLDAEDDRVRRMWTEQNQGEPEGRARLVRVFGGYVLHPDDRESTKAPSHRVKR